jgi:hypothetical protein
VLHLWNRQRLQDASFSNCFLFVVVFLAAMIDDQYFKYCILGIYFSPVPGYDFYGGRASEGVAGRCDGPNGDRAQGQEGPYIIGRWYASYQTGTGRNETINKGSPDRKSEAV